MENNDLNGKVALVTGGSRGAGRGIAIELSLAGAKVYITGRSSEGKSTTQYETNTLDESERIIKKLGGQVEMIVIDHREVEQNENIINEILKQHDTIDILVNNVWAGYLNKDDKLSIPDFTAAFWEQPLWRWENMFDTSLKTHFVISKLVAPLMIEQKSGLIVTTGFWDEDKYLSNLPYDVVKHAKNRMMYGMAIELKEYNVSCVSLSLGWIRTEHIKEMHNVDDFTYRDDEELLRTESTRYAGRSIVNLACDKNYMKWTGKTVTTGELARYYGFTDIDGTQPEKFVIPDKSKGITQR